MRATREIASNEQAWDIASQKYAQDEEFKRDIEMLRENGSSLFPCEIEEIGDFSSIGLAVHLCCSHGTDLLSILNHGAKAGIGIDISQQMLSLAQAKTDTLGSKADWIHADVLDEQPALKGSADLVYTGRGGLPWVRDLELWARRAEEMLKPGGRLYVFEGHPLNWVWARDTAKWQVIRGYFQSKPQANQDFPAMAVEQYADDKDQTPQAYEWQWSIADIVTAIAGSGLQLQFLHEHPFNFWPLFDEIDQEQDGLVPQSFSLMAIKA
ncbi:MAG: class I SAM-dependent methyltransferase [Pseudomonadota bacterium]